MEQIIAQPIELGAAPGQDCAHSWIQFRSCLGKKRGPGIDIPWPLAVSACAQIVPVKVKNNQI
jgi:hypothetical protein